MTDRVVYLTFARPITKHEQERLFQLQQVDRLVDDGDGLRIVLLNRPIREDDFAPTLDIIRMIMGEPPVLGVIQLWSGLEINPVETKLMVHEWMPVRRPAESLDDFIHRMRVFTRIEKLVWEAEGKAA